MDLSDELDLDSLIGLIDESEPEKELNTKDKKPKPQEAFLLDDIFSSTAIKSPETLDKFQGSVVHTGDTSEEEEDRGEHLTETGQLIKQKIKIKSKHDVFKNEKITWKNKINPSVNVKENAQPFDKRIGIRIINPLVSYDIMEKRLQGRRLIKLSFMKNFLQKGDIEGDWVTIAVVVKKLPPKTSKNGKVFSIWKLTDLHDTAKLASLFLFGEIHKEHWKTASGAVIGLLNPSFLEARDKEDYASMTIDHPGKIMQIGTSKDFGHCKSSRKDGTQCTNVVNLAQCQFCAYHVKTEYKKFSRRSDIQTSWTGRDLSLKDRLLKGQNFFYAGQTFAALGKPERKSSSISQKDKLTLSNLTLKRKAATVFHEEKQQSIKKINDTYGDTVAKAAEKNSQFINQRLMIPSPGSQNLLCHMQKNQVAKGEQIVDMRSAKEHLRLNMLHMNARKMSSLSRKEDSAIIKNLTPVLGKGFSPGQTISFDFSSHTSQSYAKIRAIQKIKQNGPIIKKDPNAIKSCPELKKIRLVLEHSAEEELADNKGCENKKSLSYGKLGCIDLNSEKVKKYLKQKSSHAFEVELAEMEKEAAYFARMEKKEQMEEKMSAQKELICDVVSCKQCRYTAHKAADRCKNENHPLKCHKAIKRFFECKDCYRRTECFSRFPQQSCRHCGGSRYERTGMLKVRSGPKLDSEILHITGDEVKNLNSL